MTQSVERSDNSFLVRALAKGLSVLDLFDSDHRDWDLDEIAEHAALPRMTAYRMVRTLERSSYLVRDPLTSRYHLGPAMLAAMYLAEGYSDLVTVARPYLEALAAETGESATLAVEVDGVAVSVDMVDTARPFRREVAVGRIIGDTANCNGKLFAAFKPEVERERIVAAAHARSTPHTITDPEVLEEELERVRREDVAFDLEERDLGTCAVGAPVRDQLGDIVATVSLIVPSGRFGPQQRTSYAQAVQATASELSAFLGYARRD